MKTRALIFLALSSLASSALAGLSGPTAGVNSLAAKFAGTYQWRDAVPPSAVTFVIEKKWEVDYVIHFSGHDAYVEKDGSPPVTMEITGEIDRKDHTITFTEAHPSDPDNADVDGVFKGKVSRDLKTITAVWNGNDGRSGDLKLGVAAPGSPATGSPGAGY